jgi:hypothetical protein
MPNSKPPPLPPKSDCGVRTVLIPMGFAGLIFLIWNFQDDIPRFLTGLVGKLVDDLPPVANPRANKTIGDLVQHFRSGGLRGNFSPMVLGPSGAKEGGSFHGEQIRVWIYRFEDSTLAESLEKSGMLDMKCHRNGKFVMAVDKGEDETLPLFQRF